MSRGVPGMEGMGLSFLLRRASPQERGSSIRSVVQAASDVLPAF